MEIAHVKTKSKRRTIDEGEMETMMNKVNLKCESVRKSYVVLDRSDEIFGVLAVKAIENS